MRCRTAPPLPPLRSHTSTADMHTQNARAFFLARPMSWRRSKRSFVAASTTSLAVVLPLAGLWAEQEWVHQVFALSALPITVFAMTRPFHDGARASFILLAGSGLALLIGAAFIEGLHDLETPLTVVGALLLATAHIRRWRRQHEARLTNRAGQ